MTVKKIAILTSGGDAPGMNAAIRGVLGKGLYHGFEMLGVQNGFEGLINGEFIEMSSNDLIGVINQGGTILKTARSEGFKTVEGLSMAVAQIKKHGIDMVVVVGGDGSLQGAKKLASVGIGTALIPASIDNDIPGTEYCIGFDTALNTILEAVRKIQDTIASHSKVAIVEVMGRNSGHLALMSGMASGAEAILVPEIPTDMELICQSLVERSQQGKLYSIIIVAEGVGKGPDIAEEIAIRTKLAVHVTVLGYIQRGGCPSATDNIMGSKMGALAIDTILSGHINFLVALRKGNLLTVPYEVEDGFESGIEVRDYDLSMILGMG
ncbi:ATP-dependent 6-phosphofructokinase [Pelosinus sp. sgz500959]|uniref:ATP-dependent 6-phosphofructokinase n=1 Tax=Pelosinus sp. sgz500959 TaxID=3242472 RepID=UPI00366F713D